MPIMKRQIVVEGPDGGGKTNLVNDLVKLTGRTIHTRPCTSEAGVIDPDNLHQWVVNDLHDMGTRPEKYIYDRHPVISEPVYGLIIRRELRGAFATRSWLNAAIANLAELSVVVFCLPPWDVVRANIEATHQMSGVKESGFEIYTAYRNAAWSWPGPWVIHDYTAGDRDRTLANIIDIAERYDGRS